MKKKKGTKRTSTKFLKSRVFLLAVALILAIVVIFGVSSFAGGAKTKGRVYSWKEGKVAQDYTVVTAPPSAYQYVSFNTAEWGDGYLGIYTEMTEPEFGSRNLKVGDTGEDVRVLKSALKTIGTFPIYKGDANNGQKVATYKDVLNKVSPILATIDVANPSFDASLTQAIEAISYPNLDSSYGTYLKDSVLDQYEQTRILGMATSTWGASTQGKYLAFDSIRPDMSTYKVAAPIAGYSVHTSDYNGQAAYRRSNEPIYKAYPILSYQTKKTSPEFDSRILVKGDKGADVTTMQQMLETISKNGQPISFSKYELKVNGIFDAGTEAVLWQFERYFDLKTDGKADARIVYHIINEFLWPLYR